MLGVLMTAGILGGCDSTYRGTLHGGIVGIGGEHTGFELEQDDGSRLEVDPCAQKAAAEKLAGGRVEIDGRVEERGYVERRTVRVLKVKAIRGADECSKPAAPQQ